MRKLPVFILFAISLLFSCKTDKKPFSVSNVNFMSNTAGASDSVIKMRIDLDEVVLNGIEIPTKKLTANGFFNFSFKIKNTSSGTQVFFYKFYYQNETYKFEEGDKLAGENFYGSWENPQFIFKSTKQLAPGEEIEIRDSFRIVGNPRDERAFYGSDPMKHIVNDESIQSTINYIKTIPEWVNKITENARRRKISLEEQMYMDALWSLNEQRERDSTYNNRWKRNPRMGVYKFLLVITNPEDFDVMPAEIKDLSRKTTDNNFINPFSYFLSDKPDNLKYTTIVEIGKKLQVITKVDFTKGMFINPLTLNRVGFTKDYYNADCNDSIDKYKNAQVELFIHNINRDFVLHNVPELADVTGENFSRSQYEAMIKKYTNSSSLVNTYVNVTDCPCKNARVNKAENSVTLVNPGNIAPPFKKEHVGVNTRIGFTYGKFRAKIKFPEMLSKENVWNGITNAFWMIAQDVNSDWNMRRPCNAEVAYIPKQEPDNESSLQRSRKQITYSEIDFEIVKDSKFWPRTSYNKSNANFQEDNAANNDDIMVTCTNWDMACHEPEKFSIGAKQFEIDGEKYLFHRWNSFYKALTTKIPVKHDEIFKKPYYYFEIEWLPEKIIWRIGPEKDKMKVICVMDKTISAIPNNQMVMIITQEWHNQEWWPTAPYKQNFIPFPKKDIIGKVLEIEIE
ncbi:MAG TPA: hypothetical protein VNZ49_05670 [Bacteroidia bacterium]|jgi:hypothetical protein|nr:hypothetical protein [Bacteroidia bacterium]